jgi:hemoglobin
MMTPHVPVTTLYELLGGDPKVRQLVNCFYDLMDRQPEFAALRAMHGKDLTVMREKLADWLSGWLGGPALYDERPDATCIGHAHAPFKIDQQMNDEWMTCMSRALDDALVPAAVQARLRPPLAALAGFLRNQ